MASGVPKPVRATLEALAGPPSAAACLDGCTGPSDRTAQTFPVHW